MSQLERAARLHEQGILNDAEFADLKQRILHGDSIPVPQRERVPPAPTGEPSNESQTGRATPDWQIALLLLSGIAGFVAAAPRGRSGREALGSLVRQVNSKPSASATDGGSGGGKAPNTTSTPHPDGSVSTTYNDGRGNIVNSESVPVPDSGGTIDTTIRNADGTTTQMRSAPDGQGGVTTWTANPDGSNSVRYPDGTVYTVPAGSDPDAPAASVAHVSPDSKTVDTTIRNADGSTSTAHSQLGDDGVISTQTTNPDGSHSQSLTSAGRSGGKPGTIVTNPDGSRVVIQSDGTMVPVDRYGDVIDGPNYWNQYDPETGTWRTDPVEHRGPITISPDGTSAQEWFYRDGDGNQRSATAYFDRDGNLTSLQSSDYTGVTVTQFETVDGRTRPTGTTKLDAGNVIDDSQIIFDAAMAATGIGEAYTAGRILGTELIVRELAAQGLSRAEIDLITSQLATSGTSTLAGAGKGAGSLGGDASAGASVRTPGTTGGVPNAEANNLGLNAEELGWSNTAGDHMFEYGSDMYPSRPYLRSPNFTQMIIDSVPPVPDPGGVPGGMRWDVPGTLRGSPGTYELVIDVPNGRILHYMFRSNKG
ncbi:SHOCT domain-containing protein [Nocardia sp. NPDC006044]|uniref:SHOCT domain-containing protein n=1 Tax=Nocardia sp. NPDC006044 TaxID=3364306 RepID=UPI0036D16AF8